MDQRERQADGQAAEALGRAPRGRSQDHQQEDGGEHHLGDQRGHQSVATRRMHAVAVGGEAADVGARLARGDQIEQPCRHDGAQHLRGDVARQVGRPETPAHRQSDGDRRIEVAA